MTYMISFCENCLLPCWFNSNAVEILPCKLRICLMQLKEQCQRTFTLAVIPFCYHHFFRLDSTAYYKFLSIIRLSLFTIPQLLQSTNCCSNLQSVILKSLVISKTFSYVGKITLLNFWGLLVIMRYCLQVHPDVETFYIIASKLQTRRWMQSLLSI